jgi:hypothetical protein
VIEVLRQGSPQEVIIDAQKIADLIEKVALISYSLSASRDEIHKKLSINSYRRSIFDISIGHDYKSYRSREKTEKAIHGIKIDQRFISRFEKCGFPQLVYACISKNHISERLNKVINWLFESRLEPLPSSAIVKTAISLESLFIFDEKELLSKSLSERAAYILSSDPDECKEISAIIKKFYTLRGNIVHGDKKGKAVNPGFIEGVDRLIILACLKLAANASKWQSNESLRAWYENERWGMRDNILIPYPKIYLKNSINISNKNSK